MQDGKPGSMTETYRVCDGCEKPVSYDDIQVIVQRWHRARFLESKVYCEPCCEGRK